MNAFIRGIVDKCYLKEITMSDHYYTDQPSSEHDEKTITVRLAGHVYQFITDSGVFSKNRMDQGSEILFKTFVEQASISSGSRILELGSGYGPIIIAIGRTFPNSHCVGLEINERAYDLSRRNANLNQADNVDFIHGGLENLSIEASVDNVLTNPPFRAGKILVHQFVNTAHSQLKSKGALWVVVQRKQGAPSLSKHMSAVFGNVERVALEKGYWVLKSIKA